MEASMDESKDQVAYDHGHIPQLRGWALASVLIGLMLTLLLSALDQTVVGTALPKIIGELNGFDLYTWVVTIYLLTSTTVIPVVGKLSDQFGRKWFIVSGIVIFLVGSALSGASQSMMQLVIFRGIQGFGAGILQALIFTVVGDIFTPSERARWQGLFTGVFALASVIGPAVGGWITDNATWRWVFYVNLPVGGLALIVLLLWFPSNISVRTSKYTGWAAIKRIDFIGSLTAAGATVCLLLGLSWGGQQYAWSSKHVVGVLAASALLYIIFILNERWAEEPIMPLKLFRNQTFAVGGVLSLVLGAAIFAMALYIPLFIQGVLGNSATSSGAAITPLMLSLAVSAAIVGQVVARIGKYQFITVIGACVMIFGSYLLYTMSSGTGLGEVTRNMIVVGIGMGLIMPIVNLAVQNAIPRSQLGVGTGAINYLRATGSTIGTALLGTVVDNTVTNELSKNLPAAAHKLPAQLLSAATNQQVLVSSDAQHHLLNALPAQMQALILHIFDITRQALASGLHNAFGFTIGICVIGLLFTFFLKDVPLQKRTKSSSTAGDEGEPVIAMEMI